MAGNKIETSLTEEMCEFMCLYQKEDFDNGTLDRLTMNQSKRHDYDRRDPKSRNAHQNGSHNREGDISRTDTVQPIVDLMIASIAL